LAVTDDSAAGLLEQGYVAVDRSLADAVLPRESRGCAVWVTSASRQVPKKGQQSQALVHD